MTLSSLSWRLRTLWWNLLRSIKQTLFFKRLRYQDWRAGRQLQLVQDRLLHVDQNDILLFACLRNEKLRMPFFLDYYRKLGVKHFFLVDNASTDGFREWCKDQPDVSVWHTDASYKAARFGMQWLNDLLYRHGSGHWCVVVDPDEFLVYPHMETRSLMALSSFLDEEKRSCMHAVMLDAYSDLALQETRLEEGQSPFDVCPYFDLDGYVQSEGWGGSTWIRGGVRLRKQFRDNPAIAPALNKIPFIKWEKSFHYNLSMHDARPLRLNRGHTPGEISTTGAIFHFKMVASLQQKAQEEAERQQHYAGGREYVRYQKSAVENFYEPGISVRFLNSSQLVALGLMSPGRWF